MSCTCRARARYLGQKYAGSGSADAGSRAGQGLDGARTHRREHCRRHAQRLERRGTRRLGRLRQLNTGASAPAAPRCGFCALFRLGRESAFCICRATDLRHIVKYGISPRLPQIRQRAHSTTRRARCPYFPGLGEAPVRLGDLPRGLPRGLPLAPGYERHSIRHDLGRAMASSTRPWPIGCLSTTSWPRSGSRSRAAAALKGVSPSPGHAGTG